MEPLVIAYIIVGSVLRIVGIFVSIDFFIRKKEIKFIYFIIAWNCYFLAEIAVLFFLSSFLNTFFGSLGMIFNTAGLLTYYIEIKVKSIMEIIGIVITIIFCLFYFLGEEIASNVGVIIFLITFVILIMTPLLRYSNFKKQIGKSIVWYYGFIINSLVFLPISFIITANGSIFDVYYLKNEIFINIYFCGIINSQLLMLIFLIHIEYNHSSYLNSKLIDNYSHDLGNILQSIQLSFEFFSQNLPSGEYDSEVFTLATQKFKDATDLLKKIRKLETN